MKTFPLLFIVCIAMAAASCMERYDDRYFIKGHSVEFEEATTRGKALGKDYVVSNQTVRSESGTIRLQVNLVGAPLESDQIIPFQIRAEETTAVSGRDYMLPEKSSLTIPAQSNVGYLEVKPTATGEGETLLVIELVGNDLIQVSENYKQLAIRCIYPE